jgi:MFS family permease
MFRIRRVFDDTLPLDRREIAQVQAILREQFPGADAKDVDMLPARLKDPIRFGWRYLLFVADDLRGRVRGFALVAHGVKQRFVFLDWIASTKGGTGIAIGGFWSLSTAILARLASGSDLPKAIALLQGGTALAIVIAPPLGSDLGELIGWRGAFLVTVPVGLAALLWQLVVLPPMPPMQAVSVTRMFLLLRNRTFAVGMAATGLAFIGMNSLSIYLRPLYPSRERAFLRAIKATIRWVRRNSPTPKGRRA